jgi:Protein of unknown function (DUF3703)
LSDEHPGCVRAITPRCSNFALRQQDRRDALGQVLRLIVAAPGSMTGRYPVGNTGRVEAGLMTPMPLPDDLASALAN